MKPDRYEWLRAEQKKTAYEGSEVRRAWRMHRQMTDGGLIVVAVFLCMFAVVGQLPRDPNGAMQLRYLAPACVVVAMVSVAMLWKRRVQHPSLRFAAWSLLFFSIFFVTIGAIP